MFKKVEPAATRWALTVGKQVQFPHCDSRILHAPGECEFCDRHPEWQHLRSVWGIAFTGYTPEEKELPCPADFARGDKHALWPGNRAAREVS